MRGFFQIGLVVMAGVGLAGPAMSGEFGVSELRAGVLAHSIDEPGPNGETLNFSRIQDLTFEVLFTSPDADVFRWLGSPRPNVGATINFGGLESMAHLGLTWHAPLFETPLFVEGTFGAAINNGAQTGASWPARNLGCSLMFYESVGVGVNVGEMTDIVLVAEHSSNANLCAVNRGLSNVGVKFGVKF